MYHILFYSPCRSVSTIRSDGPHQSHLARVRRRRAGQSQQGRGPQTTGAVPPGVRHHVGPVQRAYRQSHGRLSRVTVSVCMRCIQKYRKKMAGYLPLSPTSPLSSVQ